MPWCTGRLPYPGPALPPFLRVPCWVLRYCAGVRGGKNDGITPSCGSRSAAPTFTDFGIRLAKYSPLSLAAMMFYVMLAVIVHAALGAVLRGGRRAGERQAL